MKTFGSWRAQKGMKVYFAVDRKAGTGTIVKVVPGSPTYWDREFIIRSDAGGADISARHDQLRKR